MRLRYDGIRCRLVMAAKVQESPGCFPEADKSQRLHPVLILFPAKKSCPGSWQRWKIIAGRPSKACSMIHKPLLHPTAIFALILRAINCHAWNKQFYPAGNGQNKYAVKKIWQFSWLVYFCCRQRRIPLRVVLFIHPSVPEALSPPAVPSCRGICINNYISSCA